MTIATLATSGETPPEHYAKISFARPNLSIRCLMSADFFSLFYSLRFSFAQCIFFDGDSSLNEH